MPQPDRRQSGTKIHDDALIGMWGLVALAPLLILLFSFILQKWHWGLMDDSAILGAGTGIAERFGHYFRGLCAWGVFRPTFAAHAAITYTIFAHNAHAFYIFRLFEVALVLGVWGLCAKQLSGQGLALVLLPAVTLSFHYFYDGFFYLSSQEPIGLLFVGLALYCFIFSLREVLRTPGERGARSAKMHWPSWVLGLIFLLCAFGAKEPFVSCGIAFGLSYLYLAWMLRKTSQSKRIWWAGGTLLIVTALYAFFLLVSIKSQYSAGYTFHLPKLLASLVPWLKKDLLNHVPWIVGAVYIIFAATRKNILRVFWQEAPLAQRWGLVLAGLFYAGYLLILLPWNTLSYYATPFGVFFALIIVLLLAEPMSRANKYLNVVLVLGAFALNLLVCQYVLLREGTYQYDTANLIQWMRDNKALFKMEQTIVASNAMEASFAVRHWVNAMEGGQIVPFHWIPDPEGLIGGEKSDFYLYSPRFQSVDLNRLKAWRVLFLSHNWVMYERVP